jgi:hypothetical protein
LHKRQAIIQHDADQSIQRFLFLGLDQLFVHLAFTKGSNWVNVPRFTKK